MISWLPSHPKKVTQKRSTVFLSRWHFNFFMSQKSIATEYYQITRQILNNQTVYNVLCNLKIILLPVISPLSVFWTHIFGLLSMCLSLNWLICHGRATRYLPPSKVEREEVINSNVFYLKILLQFKMISVLLGFW